MPRAAATRRSTSSPSPVRCAVTVPVTLSSTMSGRLPMRATASRTARTSPFVTSMVTAAAKAGAGRSRTPTSAVIVSHRFISFYSLVSVIVPFAESSVADVSESARSVYPCHASPMPIAAPSVPRASMAMREPSAACTTPRRIGGGGGGAGGTVLVTGGACGNAGGGGIGSFCSTVCPTGEISPRRSCAAENGFRRAVRFAAAESPAISVSDGVMDAFCPITTGSSASGHRRYAPLTAIKRTAPPSAHCRMEISRNDALHRSITRSLPKHRKGLLHEVFASYSSLSLRPYTVHAVPRKRGETYTRKRHASYPFSA